MAFPLNPTDGQTATNYGRSYQYNSALDVWRLKVATLPTRADISSLESDVLPAENASTDLGSATKRFQNIHLDGSIFIEDKEFTPASILDFDLAIAPEVLEIQVDAPQSHQDTSWLWTWTTSSLPYSRVDITNQFQASVPLYKQGTYAINNYAANDLHGAMTQTHSLYLKWVDGAGTQNNVDWVTNIQSITDSHPDINGGSNTSVQRLSFAVPSTFTPPTLVAPTVSYDVSFVTAGSYTFIGSAQGDNPNLGPFYRGGTYTFNLDSSLASHPFYLTTDNGTNFATGTYFGEYTSGVVGSRNTSGTLVFTIPLNAPDTLYYQCGVHGAMRGAITVKDLAVEVNNNGNYVLYLQHTQEGHKTPVEIRPIPSLVNQMCLVYDSVSAKFVPQDLATYVERTPSFKNKIQEIAGTATLIAPDGTSLVPTVNVIEDASYLPLVGNTVGDLTYASDTETLYIWSGTLWSAAGAGAFSGASLGLLGDVNTTSNAPIAGQALVWDDVNSQWIPGTVAASGGGGTSTQAKTYYWEGGLQENVSKVRLYINSASTLNSINTNVASAGNTEAIFKVKKNGTVIQTITLDAVQLSNSLSDLGISIVSGDYLTVDIFKSSSASDLYVNFIYQDS